MKNILLSAEREVVTPSNVKEGLKSLIRSGIKVVVKPIAKAARKLQIANDITLSFRNNERKGCSALSSFHIANSRHPAYYYIINFS